MMTGEAGKLVLIFGLGVQELLLILLALIFLFGAKKIPEIARGLGKGLSEFKKAADDQPDAGNDNDKDKDQKDSPKD